MRFVPIKTVDQLDLQAVHRVRDRLIELRTGTINQLRAFLLERGLVMRTQPPGRNDARLAAAFTGPDLTPKLSLLQRYESRWHRMYQRAMHNLIALREYRPNQEITGEPNPISEQAPDPQVEVHEAFVKVPPTRVEFPDTAQTGPQAPLIHPPVAGPAHRPAIQGKNPAA
jgi:hypothetical protein